MSNIGTIILTSTVIASFIASLVTAVVNLLGIIKTREAQKELEQLKTRHNFQFKRFEALTKISTEIYFANNRVQSTYESTSLITGNQENLNERLEERHNRHVDNVGILKRSVYYLDDDLKIAVNKKIDTIWKSYYKLGKELDNQ